VGKSGVLEHKSGNISETRTDRGKVTVTAYRNSPTLFPTAQATGFKFGQYIQRVYPNKSLLKIVEKRERVRIQGLPNFFGYPLLSLEREKLRISNLASTFRGSTRTKVH